MASDKISIDIKGYKGEAMLVGKHKIRMDFEFEKMDLDLFEDFLTHITAFRVS